MSRRPRISAIVVTRNNRQDIGACLEALERSSRPLDETIVIDNQSADGTGDFVRQRFPSVLLLEYWDNPGFGEGNNRGFLAASGEFYFLVNPDANVAPDCIERLAAKLESDPQMGVVVPKVLLSREPEVLNSAGLLVNRIAYACDRGYLEWDRGQFDQPEPILAGSGCALLLRASMIRAVGGFDPAYFLYYEDLDLCMRSWIAGFSVYYAPDARVWHAMKVTGRSDFYNEYLDNRNRLRTLLKNLSWPALIRTIPVSSKFDLTAVLYFARERRWPLAALRLKAWGWNLMHAASIIAHRRTSRAGRMPRATFDRFLVDGTGSPRIRAPIPDYREVYDDTVNVEALGSRVELGPSDAGKLGLGWYGVEQSEGRSYRWCCGYGILFLKADAGPVTKVLELTCFAAVKTTVAVTVNRRRVGIVTVSAGGWTTVSLPVESEGTARIELLPESVFVPSDAAGGSSDARTLGVAVSEVGFRS